MKLKTYNIFMLVATLIAWLGLFMVVASFDPYQAGILVMIFFYLSFGLSILGSLTLLGFWLRKLFMRKKELSHNLVSESFRQAIIFSCVLVIALLLQSARLLTWWNIILIILAATMLEFIFLVFRQQGREN